MSTKKFLFWISAIFVALVGSSVITHAAQFYTQESGQDVISLTKPVDETVFLVGNTIEVASPVNGDVIAAGRTVKITGSIANNLFVTANTVIIDGSIRGEAFVFAGTLILDDNATLTKNVYTYNSQVIRKPNASIIGKIISPASNQKTVTERLTNHILATLALLVFGFAVAMLFPKSLKKTTEVALDNWGATILWGVIGFILVPTIGALLMITRIGLPLGLIIITFYIIDLYASSIVIGATLGRIMTNSKSQLPWAMVIGVVLLQILRFIVVVQFIVTLAVIVWGFGAILLTKKMLAHHFRHDL